jgi:hypothetical protein
MTMIRAVARAETLVVARTVDGPAGFAPDETDRAEAAKRSMGPTIRVRHNPFNAGWLAACSLLCRNGSIGQAAMAVASAEMLC